MDEMNGMANLKEIEACDLFMEPITVFEILEYRLIFEVLH